MQNVIATDSLSYIMLNDSKASVFKVSPQVYTPQNRRNYLPVLTTCLTTASVSSASFWTRLSQIQFPYDYKVRVVNASRLHSYN